MTPYLHIMISEKFLAPFIDFMDENFRREGHRYVFITSEKYQFGLTKEHIVEFLFTDQDIFQTLLQYMKDAEKIIIHGLWRDKIDKLLLEHPFLLEKTYWVMWGGDFYFPEKQTENRKKVIQNVRYLVTGTAGEVDYVRAHYSARGEHIKAFVYTSNLYKDIAITEIDHSAINILVGNSAAPTNRHIEALQKLLPYKHENIRIFLPFSYAHGSTQYSLEVIKYGYEQFGDKFNAMIDLMNEKEYYAFLSTIDIAVFNHNRQQGMGNIITLLGCGKKVFMNSEVSTYTMFLENNIKVFSADIINISLMDSADKEKNIHNVKKMFSKETFIKQLTKIF